MEEQEEADTFMETQRSESGQYVEEEVEMAQQPGEGEQGVRAGGDGGEVTRAKRKERDGEGEAEGEARSDQRDDGAGGELDEMEVSNMVADERARRKRQLELGVVEDMMEEESVEDSEHAHKRGRHEQTWRDVVSGVEPRRDKSVCQNQPS